MKIVGQRSVSFKTELDENVDVSLPTSLLRRSNLTDKQIEAILQYIRVSSHEIRYRDAASSMSRPVSIGSYYKTVQQGRRNVRESIATVLIAIRIGLVRMEDVRRLFELVGRGDTQVFEPDEARFSEVLGVLLDRMVM